MLNLLSYLIPLKTNAKSTNCRNNLISLVVRLMIKIVNNVYTFRFANKVLVGYKNRSFEYLFQQLKRGLYILEVERFVRYLTGTVIIFLKFIVKLGDNFHLRSRQQYHLVDSESMSSFYCIFNLYYKIGQRSVIYISLIINLSAVHFFLRQLVKINRYIFGSTLDYRYLL